MSLVENAEQAALTEPGVKDGLSGERGGVERLRSFLRGPDGKPVKNIAPLLEAEELDRIGSRVRAEYDLDIASNSEWRERSEKAMELALQIVKAKTSPFPKAANVKYPLVTTAAIQFAARAYPAIVPGTNMVKGKVQGKDEGQPQKDQGGEIVLDQEGQPRWEVEPGAKQKRAGRIGRHMTWQLMEEMEEWEEDTDTLLHVVPIVGCAFRKSYFDPDFGRNVSEMVLPKYLIVNAKTKSLKTCPRITHEFPLYPYQIEERKRSGLFVEDFEPGQAVEGGDDKEAEHWFFEQIRNEDLDGDGYPEPYLCTVHKQTNKTVRVIPCFRERNIIMHPSDETRVVRIERTDYYTKYPFIPNPDGSFYDIGFGILMQPLNRAVNTTINRLLDSGTLANMPAGFISNDLKLNQQAGVVRFKPGEFKITGSQGGKMADAIFQLDFKEPSQVLFHLLGLLIDAAKEISSVKDVMTGERQPANQSATTTMALIEQGMKVFTAIYKRIHRALKQEFKKLFALNALYLQETSYFQLLDDVEAVYRQDYELGSLDVIPVSDPNLVTDMQRMAKAELLLAWRDDPFVNPKELRRRYFEASGQEDVPDLLEVEEQGPDPQLLLAIEQLKIEKERVNLERIKTEAAAMLALANAMKALAQAEAAEQGAQADLYKTQVQELGIYIKGSNEARANDDAARAAAAAKTNGSAATAN